MEYKKELELELIKNKLEKNNLINESIDEKKVLNSISDFFKSLNYKFGQINDKEEVHFNYSKDIEENKYYINVANELMCKQYDKYLVKVLSVKEKDLNKWIISSKYLLNLPHSSIYIPERFKKDYYLNEEDLDKEIVEYADLYTEELFDSLFNFSGGLKNEYSRLLVDVERFFDDDFEDMQVKHQMGWFYENMITVKKPLRNLNSKEELSKYYKKYHEELNKRCQERLDQFDECIVIDCHSFSNKRYWFHDKSIDEKNLPDICIGYEDYHKDDRVVSIIKKVFKDYNIQINNPYQGSLVPTNYWGKDKRVKSVMIEINKKLYLEEDNKTKSKNYKKLKEKIKEFSYQLFYKY